MVASPVRGSMAAMVLIVASLAGCTGAASGDDPLAPTAPAGNVADRMIRIAIAASAIQPPYEVVEIRQGQIDELSGVTPEAEAAASVTAFATDRHSLDRQAWRVRIIGSTCSGDPCSGSRVLVETIIDTRHGRVIAVRMNAVASAPASVQP